MYTTATISGMLSRKFSTLAYYSDLHATRFLLGFAELWCSLTMFLDFSDSDDFTTTVMASMFPAQVWGALFLVIGILQFTILFTGNYHTRVSTWFAGVSSIFWWLVCLSMVLSSGVVPATISGEVSLALGASWVWIRSGTCLGGRRHDD